MQSQERKSLEAQPDQSHARITLTLTMNPNERRS